MQQNDIQQMKKIEKHHFDELNKRLNNKPEVIQIDGITGGVPAIDERFIDKSLPSDKLLEALYFIWEASDRGQLDMFLVGDTAKQVIAQEELSGDKITVGVRKNQWISGQGRIVRDYLQHELRRYIDERDPEFTYQGVPIVIKQYEDNPCLQSLNPIFYKYETFHIPDPYKEFVEKYE